jgi:hypothetical protein
VTTFLTNALPQNWNFWFARIHENLWGKFYSLFYDYRTGNQGVITRLDYNITQNAWTRFYSLDGNGDHTAYHNATVFDGGTDLNEYTTIDGRGYVYQEDTSGTVTDVGLPIPILWRSKRFSFNGVGELREVYLRMEGVSDSLTLTCTCGGSDYLTVAKSYTVSLAGSGDTEARILVERELKGRWVELSLSGSVSGRPAVRELAAWFSPIRERKSTSDV